MVHTQQKGQTLLIMLLVLAIAITVALSLIGRATSDISVTRQLEESSRAFSAAEAGIEKSLLSEVFTGESITTTIDESTNTKVTTSARSLGGVASEVYALPQALAKGESGVVWLVGHDADGNVDEDSQYEGTTLDVCWEKGTPISALSLAVVYKQDAEYFEQRGAYDPDGDRRTLNKFSNVDDQAVTVGCGDIANVYHKTITIPTGAFMLRITPYYAAAKIFVSPEGDNSLPVQGKEVISEGTTGNGITRKIIVKQQYDAIPDFLDFSIYSKGDFAKIPVE